MGNEAAHKAKGRYAIHDITAKGDGEAQDAARLKSALAANRLLCKRADTDGERVQLVGMILQDICPR